MIYIDFNTQIKGKLGNSVCFTRKELLARYLRPYTSHCWTLEK